MILHEILNELSELSEQVDESELNEMATVLLAAERIFVAGAGRSGCIASGFANRLLHIEKQVSVVGEVTAPPITEKDVLFVLSGSGKTSSLLTMAEKAISYGAEVVTITMNREGIISNMATRSIILPGTTRLAESSAVSIQPIGNPFEQLAWLTCDALIILMKNRLHLSDEDLLAAHANLE